MPTLLLSALQPVPVTIISLVTNVSGQMSLAQFPMQSDCTIVTISGPLFISGAAGGGVRISVSGEPKVPGAASTIAEEAVDQLQENEKLVAGNRYVLKL